MKFRDRGDYRSVRDRGDYRSGDHVTFVYGNIVSQQNVFTIFSLILSNFY